MIDAIRIIGQEKKTILLITFIFTLVGLIISLLTTNIYTAKTSFLQPPHNQTGAASALATLIVEGASRGRLPDDLYVAFLNSETIQNNLIQRFKLQERYEKKTLLDTRKALFKNIKIVLDGKTGLISVTVDDKSAEFAAQLANGYFEELRRLLNHFAISEAQHRRVFFEKLMGKTKEALVLAELAAKKVQETSGAVSLDARTSASIKILVELRAQIALKEIQFQLASSATAQNVVIRRLGEELVGLRGQLNEIEQGVNNNLSKSGSEANIKKLFALREVKYQAAVLDMFVTQYELARLEEAEEGPLIQQVDIATAPEESSKPKRTRITVLSAIGGLLFALLIVFVRRTVKKEPALVESLPETSQG